MGNTGKVKCNLTNLKKLLLAAGLIIIMNALAACTSMPAPVTTSVPTQSPTAVIPPVTTTTPTSSPSRTASFPPTGTNNTIEFGSRTLTNNTWGAPADEKLTSGLYLSNNGSYGWYWNRLEPKTNPGITGVQPIYPNVRVGGGPAVKSNSAYFPLLAADIESLKFEVEYRYQTLPTGVYNLAYEMLFSDKNQPSPSLEPKAEAMIWIHATFGQPPSSYQGEVTDGNNVYRLYSWVREDGRLYACFFMEGEPEPEALHTVDAKRLLDNLSLDPNWYLLGVELGSEVVSGSGEIEISKLVVNMNGHKP